MSETVYSSLKYFIFSHPAPFVALVEINRPDKLNAFHEPMWRELGELFRTLSHDQDVRVVLLGSACPKAFCAGLDVVAASQPDYLDGVLGGEKGNSDGARTAQTLRRHIDDFQTSVGEIEKCEKPVIALLHGVCYGLAVDIACCADIRLAASSARFCVKEVDIGLAADIGSLARLPKIVGSASWVRELSLSARIFDGEEAARMGFVSRVLKDEQTMAMDGLKLAKVIASKSPVAVMGTKELLLHSRDHGVQENLRYTRIWNSGMLQTDDIKAALLSGMKKTRPTFEKL